MSSPPLHYGFTNARDLLEKARRDLGRMRRALETPADTNALADSTFDFVVTAYSIRDWLLNTDRSLSADVDHLFDDRQVMGVLRHFANGTKHLKLSRDQKSDATSVSEFDATADSVQLTADSSRSINTPYVVIEMIDGSHSELIHFSELVLQKFDQFFRSHSL